MTEPDSDFEEWLAALQGKPGASDPVASALRDTVQQVKTDQELQLQAETEFPRQRLLARLKEEGLLQETKTRRRTWLLAGVSTAAAILLAVPLAMQFIRSPVAPVIDEIPRGSMGTVRIVSNDPAKVVEDTLQALQALELQPIQKTVVEQVEIQVEVSVEKLPEFSEWFAEKGGRAVVAGMYRIVIVDTNFSETQHGVKSH